MTFKSWSIDIGRECNIFYAFNDMCEQKHNQQTKHVKLIMIMIWVIIVNFYGRANFIQGYKGNDLSVKYYVYV